MRPALAIVVAACTAQPVVAPPAEAPRACAVATTGAVPSGAAIAVAATPTGAFALWVPPRGPVMMQQLDGDARPLGDAELAWDGTFDRARAALVGDQLVVAAIDDRLDITWVVSAPQGKGTFVERAILGGIASAPPIVVADGERVAPNVSYGGLYVTGFDAALEPHTARLAVLSGASTDVAAVTVARTAVVAWSTADACFVEHVSNAAAGIGWSDPAPCHAPRLAAIGGDVAFVFERDGGVYFAHGAPAALHATTATLLDAGYAPRIVATGGRYWASYVDATGAIAVVAIDLDGGVQATSVFAELLTGHELVVIAGAPRVLAAGASGLVATTICD